MVIITTVANKPIEVNTQIFNFFLNEGILFKSDFKKSLISLNF